MRERGLWPEIEVAGEIPECPPLKMPEQTNALDMSRYIPGFVARWLRRSLVSHPEVNAKRCIGCGLCTTKCEFDAIHLTRDLPEASTMVRCEDKMGKVGAYAIKRAGKILFGKKESTEWIPE